MDIIWKKVLWYRKVSEEELIEIIWDKNLLYDYKFNLDELMPNILLKDLQVEPYNLWEIFEITFFANLNYTEESNWMRYSEITNERIEKIIFNF